MGPLRVRWLGRVPYREALALQEGLFRHGHEQHLLLLEHPHVFTHGPRADLATNVKVEPASVGAELVAGRSAAATSPTTARVSSSATRSVTVPNALGASDHVCAVQAVLVRTPARARRRATSAASTSTRACGSIRTVRTRARSRRSACGCRGAARCTGSRSTSAPTCATCATTSSPCGIADKPVTSLAEEGIDVVDGARSRRSSPATPRRMWGAGRSSARTSRGSTGRPTCRAFSRGEGAGARRAHRRGSRRRRERPGAACAATVGTPVRLLGRLADAGVTDGLAIATRKPEWLRPKVSHGPEVLALKRTLRDLVARHRVRGGRLPEPQRVLERRHGDVHGAGRAVHARLRVLPRRHAQAGGPRRRRARARRRGGRPDGPRPRGAHDGRSRRPRRRRHGARRRVRAGDPRPLAVDGDRDPDQRRARATPRRSSCCSPPVPTCSTTTSRPSPGCSGRCGPSAGYARSLSVLAAAKAAGLTTKSGIIVGMGEREDEVDGLPRRPRRRRCRHRHDRPVPAADLAPPPGRGAGSRPPSFERWARDRRGARHRSRRGEPAHPLQLPRPPGRRGGRARPAAAHLNRRALSTSCRACTAARRRPAEAHAETTAGRLGAMTQGPNAPTSVYADRVHRARRALESAGADVLLVSVGSDLPYLVGYHAMPLERLTMLVVPRDGDATLVIPRLEAPRVVEQPGVFDLLPWDETDDPVAIVSRLVPRARSRRDRRHDVGAVPRRPHPALVRRRSTCARTPSWATCGCARTRPRSPRSPPPARPPTASPRSCTRGEIPLIGRTEAEVSADISARLIAEGHDKVELRDRRRRRERSLAAPPRRRSGDPRRRDRPHRLRRHDGRLLQRHHPLRVPRHPAGGDRRGVRRAARGAGRRRRRRHRRDAVRGGRPRRAAGHRRRRLRPVVRPPHRPRHRHGGARGPVHGRGQRAAARGRARVQRRARDLRRRAGGACGSRTSSSPPTTARSR